MTAASVLFSGLVRSRSLVGARQYARRVSFSYHVPCSFSEDMTCSISGVQYRSMSMATCGLVDSSREER